MAVTPPSTDNVVSINKIIHNKEFDKAYNNIMAEVVSQIGTNKNLNAHDFAIICSALTGQLLGSRSNLEIQESFIKGLACQIYAMNKIRVSKNQPEIALSDLLPTKK